MQFGDVYANDDQIGAKVRTHLPKELEGRRYYRLTDSAAAFPGDDEEDLKAPW